ncbi:MAG: dethiobiotin synthase [Syntrophus sp. (in: bacteria)]|nr:dethiobiotin synthase [Syntrophus sp. (in: bacteria)]
MRAFFVTGTDTNVGKTLISVSLAAFFSLKKGLRVGVMKPFETGLPENRSDLFSCDGTSLKKASGSADDLATISPYTFPLPLAPESAAMLEQIEIDLNVVDNAYKRIIGNHDITIVEGAGGVLVPIKDGFFFADLIKRWNLPAVIVSRLGLGTINHTLSTCRILQAQGIKVLGVILNNTEGTDKPAAQTNPDILKKYLTAPILGIFPPVENLKGEDTPDREFYSCLCAQYINTDVIFDGALLQAP